MKRALLWLGLLLLLVIPRVAALRADAHADLCWGSGVWSDEGFYTYNARNGVLFGTEALDDFNNRTIAPLLNSIQRVVFTRLGTGLVPARAISVVFGLLALALFYDSLRRIFGRRVALLGLVLLGGEFTFLFYNRLALMESPAVCIACLAFWLWTLGSLPGLFGCGAVAMSLLAWKNNFLIFVPAPAIALVWSRASLRQLLPYATGLALALGLYLALWGIPHRAELVHMNDFYRREQLQPKTVRQAYFMVRRGLIGDRGVLQRLETRTPVLTTLGLLGLAVVPVGGRSRRRGLRQRTQRLLWSWLLIGLSLLLVLRYDPTRYYLIFYPPLAALAAVTLGRLTVLWRCLHVSKRASWVAFAVAGELFFQLSHFCLRTLGLRASAIPLSFVLGGLLAAIVTLALCRSRVPRARLLDRTVLGAFLLISYSQTLWYFTHLQYKTTNIAQQITALTGPESVILGDWGPNVCLDSSLRAIPVLQGLANDIDPVQRFHATHVLMGDMAYQQTYWRKTAPEVVKAENAVRTFQLYNYGMTLYKVPASAHSAGEAR